MRKVIATLLASTMLMSSVASAAINPKSIDESSSRDNILRVIDEKVANGETAGVTGLFAWASIDDKVYSTSLQEIRRNHKGGKYSHTFSRLIMEDVSADRFEVALKAAAEQAENVSDALVEAAINGADPVELEELRKERDQWMAMANAESAKAMESMMMAKQIQKLYDDYRDLYNAEATEMAVNAVTGEQSMVTSNGPVTITLTNGRQITFMVSVADSGTNHPDVGGVTVAKDGTITVSYVGGSSEVIPTATANSYNQGVSSVGFDNPQASVDANGDVIITLTNGKQHTIDVDVSTDQAATYELASGQSSSNFSISTDPNDNNNLIVSLASGLSTYTTADGHYTTAQYNQHGSTRYSDGVASVNNATLSLNNDGSYTITLENLATVTSMVTNGYDVGYAAGQANPIATTLPTYSGAAAADAAGLEVGDIFYTGANSYFKLTQKSNGNSIAYADIATAAEIAAYQASAGIVITPTADAHGATLHTTADSRTWYEVGEQDATWNGLTISYQPDNAVNSLTTVTSLDTLRDPDADTNASPPAPGTYIRLNHNGKSIAFRTEDGVTLAGLNEIDGINTTAANYVADVTAAISGSSAWNTGVVDTAASTSALSSSASLGVVGSDLYLNNGTETVATLTTTDSNYTITDLGDGQFRVTRPHLTNPSYAPYNFIGTPELIKQSFAINGVTEAAAALVIGSEERTAWADLAQAFYADSTVSATGGTLVSLVSDGTMKKVLADLHDHVVGGFEAVEFTDVKTVSLTDITKGGVTDTYANVVSLTRNLEYAAGTPIVFDVVRGGISTSKIYITVGTGATQTLAELTNQSVGEATTRMVSVGDIVYVDVDTGADRDWVEANDYSDASLDTYAERAAASDISVWGSFESNGFVTGPSAGFYYSTFEAATGSNLEDLLDNAINSAFDKGFEEGYKQGYADGFKDGVESVDPR